MSSLFIAFPRKTEVQRAFSTGTSDKFFKLVSRTIHIDKNDPTEVSGHYVVEMNICIVIPLK